MRARATKASGGSRALTVEPVPATWIRGAAYRHLLLTAFILLWRRRKKVLLGPIDHGPFLAILVLQSLTKHGPDLEIAADARDENDHHSHE